MTGQAVHATCIVVGTMGLLIRGKSNSGKSLLADFLIESARSRGNFAELVADDRVFLFGSMGRVVAKVPAPLVGKLEVRGAGIMQTPGLNTAAVHLIADLLPENELERLPDSQLEELLVDGVSVPRVKCPMQNVMHSLQLIRWAFRSLHPDFVDYI